MAARESHGQDFLVAGILFLEINGFRFVASEEDTANEVLAVAAGDVGQDDYAAFLRANTRPDDGET